MENPKIFINGIKFGDELDLSDNGETEVDSSTEFRHITWEINSDEVLLFYIVPKKSHNPFETAIPKKYAKKVMLKVRKHHPELDWEYAIVWLDKDNQKHRHDPKIAIKSSRVSFTHPHDDDKGSWKPWIAFGLTRAGPVACG